jgi:hypothetical protein
VCGSWKELERKQVQEGATYVWVKKVFNTYCWVVKIIEIGEKICE